MPLGPVTPVDGELSGGGGYDPSMPTNSPSVPNQSGWLDEMDSATWPAGVWTQTGIGTAPTYVSSGITAYSYALTGTQRVEIASLLSATRLDSPVSLVRQLGRVMVDTSLEFVLGIVNSQADTIGTMPTDGVWIRRDSGGSLFLSVASASAVVSQPLSVATLPPLGYFDLAIDVYPREGGEVQAVAWVAGVPVATILSPAPTGWVYPRVGAKGAGTLALDRLGRAVVGSGTGELL